MCTKARTKFDLRGTCDSRLLLSLLLYVTGFAGRGCRAGQGHPMLQVLVDEVR
jgi:hypothetical protein